jgi:hypothetical protein
LLKKLITGITIPKQYVCLPLESFEQPLSVKLIGCRGDAMLDVTQTHLFLGYKPVIIGMPFLKSDNLHNRMAGEDRPVLAFHHSDLTDTGSYKKNSIAFLSLKRIGGRDLGDTDIVLYEASHGAHMFLNRLHRLLNHARERFQKQQENNISLEGNLRDQVRIAYSVPRIISVISASNDSLMNMFPTDLHGSAGENFYVSSLRVGGKANDQVEQLRKIALSNVDAEFYKNIYGLGKNHMKDLRDETDFNILPERTPNFNCPLHEGTLGYRELELLDSVTVGIHRIHFYKTASRVNRKIGATLSHIDQYYAQWRVDHKLPSTFLI